MVTTQNFQLKGITAEHPVFNVSEQKFKKMSTMVVGSLVLVLHGDRLVEQKIIDIIPQEHANSYRFFDLSLSGTEHNFFADNILVHNKQYVPNVDSCLEESSGVCKNYSTFSFRFKEKEASWYSPGMKCEGIFRESESCPSEGSTHICGLHFYKEDDNRAYQAGYDVYYYTPIWDKEAAIKECLDTQEKSNGLLQHQPNVDSCLEESSGICKEYSTFNFLKEKETSWYPPGMKCEGIFRESRSCFLEEFTHICSLRFYKEEDNREYQTDYHIYYYTPIWDKEAAIKECLDTQEKSNGVLQPLYQTE